MARQSRIEPQHLCRSSAESVVHDLCLVYVLTDWAPNWEAVLMVTPIT